MNITQSIVFFNNETDNPTSQCMGGGNIKNGFTLGSPVQIYNGNAYSSCTTSTATEQISNLEAYPNPFSNEIRVNLSEKAKSIDIIDYTGKQIYSSKNIEAGQVNINTNLFQSGIYMIRIETENSYQIKRMVKP